MPPLVTSTLTVVDRVMLIRCTVNAGGCNRMAVAPHRSNMASRGCTGRRAADEAASPAPLRKQDVRCRRDH